VEPIDENYDTIAERAHEQLPAVLVVAGVTTIIFDCVHNAGRAQLAAAF